MEKRMTEGKGYCARRQERVNQMKLAEAVKNKGRIIVVPDDQLNKSSCS